MINFSAILCGEQQVIFYEILMMPTLQTELDFYIATSLITEKQQSAHRGIASLRLIYQDTLCVSK